MAYYDLNMNSKLITNVQDPSGVQDVATKNYVDTGNQTPVYYPNLRRAGRATGPIATNFDAAYASTSTSGGITLAVQSYPLLYAVYLKAGTVASSVSFSVGSSASGLWSRNAGLYSKDGIRQAISTATNSSSTPNTVYTMTFTSPYTIPTDDFYYIGVIILSQSTLSLYVSPMGAVFSGGVTEDARGRIINYPQTTQITTGNLSLFRTATTTTTQADLPATLVGLTLKSLGFLLWVALG